MTTKDNQPKNVSEWDAFEAKKRAHLLKLSSQREMLQAKRGDLLLAIGDGKKDKSELESIEKEIKDCNLEIETTQSVLAAIPRRRDWAQSVEIEKQVQKIEQLVNELPGYVEDVKAAMMLVIPVVQRFRSYIRTVEETEGLNRLALMMEMISAGQNVVESSIPRPGVASDPKPVPIDLYLIAFFFDDEINVKLINKVKVEVDKRIERMRNHARFLKRENTSAPQWAYCPGCYELMTGGPDNQGRSHCGKCGKTFAAEKVPGAIVAPEDQNKQEM
ncbi:MAG: hypothetical protein IT315_06830 [Anaerolineales bacterium]|nr:hypothetical protein [Anaerolineales bacterium]